MTRATLRNGRLAGVPTRSLLAVALMVATSSAWAQEVTAPDATIAASPVDADPATAASQDAASTPTDATTPPPPATDAAAQDATAQNAATDVPPPASEPVTDAQQPPTTDETVASDAAASDATPPPDTTTSIESATTDDPDATAAEADFNELYGPTGSTDVGRGEAGVIWDPWEPYNRQVHRLNNAVDRYVAHPLAKAYVKVVPRPLRSGVSNFFSNLGQPITAINALLQGKPKLAAHAAGRFLMNSTLGVAGIFDPASDAKLENANEDFGQTLGAWGWKRSRYFELPFFGPRTLRDVVGMAGDSPLSPLRLIEEDKIRVPLQGLQLVDLRAQLMSTDALREGVEDDYALVRDAWMQRRMYQINGEAGDNLPDYLKEAPIIPVNAMPVRPD